MKKLYIYNGITYSTEQSVRDAIMKRDRKIFSQAPTESIPEFWAKYGVTYVEEQEPIENLKQQKNFATKQAFLRWRNSQATLVSSLGFKIDSNERANADVNGLLVAFEDEQDSLITFRDADNNFHSLTYAQLKVLQKEIVANGSYAYVQKWAFDTQIENATTKEELDTIEVKFEGKNFSEVIGDVQ